MQRASSESPSSIAEYLNCKPECTLWRKDYCRHTAFAFEPVKLDLTGGRTSFNFKHVAVINRSADLLENLSIMVEVSAIVGGDIFTIVNGTPTHTLSESNYDRDLHSPGHSQNSNSKNVGRITMRTLINDTQGIIDFEPPNYDQFQANESLRDLAFSQRPYLVDFFGLHLIQKLRFKIGNALVDELDPFMMLAHYLQFSKTGNIESFCEMLGGKPRHMTDAQWVKERQWRAGGPQVFWIPLPLWFTNAPQYALPIVAMMYNDILAEMQMGTWDSLYVLPPPIERKMMKIFTDNTAEAGGTITQFVVNVQDMGSDRGLIQPTFTTSIVANYVYLDHQERRLFGRNINEYVGEAHQSVTQSNPTPGSNAHTMPLFFNYPTVAVSFYLLDTRDSVKEKFHTITGYGIDGNESFDQVKLVVQGSTRIDYLPASYYRKITYHRHCNEVLNTFRLYTIAFGTQLNAIDPVGAMHFQQVDTAQLHFQWDQSNPYKAKAPGNCQIFAFARYKNIFRTQLGVAGWKFSPGY